MDQFKVTKRHEDTRATVIFTIVAFAVLSIANASNEPSSTDLTASVREKRQLFFPGPVNFNTPPRRPSRQNQFQNSRRPGQQNFNSNENFGFNQNRPNSNQNRRPGSNFNSNENSGFNQNRPNQRPGSNNQNQRPNGNFNQNQRPNGNFNQNQRPNGNSNQNQRPNGNFNQFQNQRPNNQNIFDVRPTPASVNNRRTTRQVAGNDQDSFVFNNSNEMGSSSTTARPPIIAPNGNNVNSIQTQFPFVAQSSTTPCQIDCHRQYATNEYNPICGSDGSTYTNPAKILCARRCGINVQEAFRGACPGLIQNTV